MSHNMNAYSSSERQAGKRVSDAWEAYFNSQSEDAAASPEALNQVAQITQVQEEHESDLLAMDNVVGVAASLKVTGGTPTDNWGLTVLVNKKVTTSKVSKASRVPAKIGGVTTDVLEVGDIRALAFTARVRPALPGYSIGHYNITAGTFGCLVRDIRRCCCKIEKGCHCSHGHEECQGDYLILSNNHVLADVNEGKPGDLILQPGPFDGGVYPADGIATLERFEPIIFGRSGYNLVDAAVARPTFSRNVIPSIIGAVIPRGISQAFVGDLVVKAGRTTEVVNGRVLAVNATVDVGYDPLDPSKVARFHNQIITTVIGAPGDSGSLLMTRRDLNAIGLLFAGSSQITIHNHIANVETALGVRPVTAS